MEQKIKEKEQEGKGACLLAKKKKGLKGLFCLILNSSDVINVTHWNNKKNHEGNKCNNFKRQTLSRRADSGLLSAEGNPEDLLRLVSRLLQSGVLGQQHLHCRQEETEQTGWKGQLCPGMPFATQQSWLEKEEWWLSYHPWWRARQSPYRTHWQHWAAPSVTGCFTHGGWRRDTTGPSILLLYSIPLSLPWQKKKKMSNAHKISSFFPVFSYTNTFLIILIWIQISFLIAFGLSILMNAYIVSYHFPKCYLEDLIYPQSHRTNDS